MIRGLTPLIGITADSAACLDDPSTSAESAIFLPTRYTAAVEQLGGAAMILPFTSSKSALRRYLDAVDGLLISGGNFDIDPRFYGEKPIKELGRLIPERTEFDLPLIGLALERDLPVLGVCGGAQAINVALGGSLYQDIAVQGPGAGLHQRAARKNAPGHRIEVNRDTLLRRALCRQNLQVNTTHHQAVKRLGNGLIVNAVALDGIIEGIESTRHTFVVGVQWHPEKPARRGEPRRRLFGHFLATCRRFHRRGKI